MLKNYTNCVKLISTMKISKQNLLLFKRWKSTNRIHSSKMAVSNSFNESYTVEEGQVTPRLCHSRSLRFHQSMSLFLRPENFDETCANPYAALPKVRWSISMSENDDDCATDALEVLTDTKWTVFKVSPMFTFSYSETRLKNYSASIKEALERICSDEIEVTFQVKEEFSSTENDEPGVQIHIKNILENGFNTLYKGYLISWKSNKLIDSKVSEVKLPVLLCCFANKYILRRVHSTMQRLFDMSIEQVTFLQDDFMCFSSLITGYLDEDNSSQVIFTYHPPGRPASESLKFRLVLMKLIEMWRKIFDIDDTSVSVKKLLEYQLGLECHLERTFKLNLESLHLTSVLVPKQVSLNVNGKVMLKSPKMFNLLLKYLTNKL